MQPPSQRLRITFAKGDAARYSSHLDLARAWARSLRRARAPLAYSQGFNPRPRIQLAAALPLGHTGEAELLDAWFERAVDVSELRARLAGALADGLTVVDVCEVPLSGAALQNVVQSAEYRVTVEWSGTGHPRDGGLERESGDGGLGRAWECGGEGVGDRVGDEAEDQGCVDARIARVLAAPELLVERRGKRTDLRPLVERLWFDRADAGHVVLGMQLAARPGQTGRAEDVLDALGIGDAIARFHRVRLILSTG